MNPTADDARNFHCDAIHEAAHAAVSVALGRQIESVGLCADGDQAGFCKPVEADAVLWQARIESGDVGAIRDEIAILRAGCLAEKKAGYLSPSYGSARDAFQAQDAAAFGGMNRLGETLADGVALALKLLNTPNMWGGIERLANELIRTGRITGDDVEKMLALAGMPKRPK